MDDYVYQPEKRTDDFEECIGRIPPEYDVVRGWVDNLAPDTILAIHRAFENCGIPVTELHIDTNKYKEYLKEVRYGDLYHGYYKDYLAEKSFEHFIAFQLLEINSEDVFLDVASENSPVPDICSRLKECKSYRQDIMYPSGINGNSIGGDACKMSVSKGFADNVALICSLEHFGGEGDRSLFFELNRVLKPRGRICAVQFYVYTSPF